MASYRSMAVVCAANIVAACGVASAQVTYSVVAKTGDIAPGTGGRIFDSFGSPAINNAGSVLFYSDMTGSTSNDGGFWSTASGSIELEARENDLAPTLGGLVFDITTASSGYLDDQGRPVLSTGVSGAGVTTSNDGCLWDKRSGSLQVLGRQGEIAPGTGPGIVYAGTNSFFNVRVGATGMVAFSSVVSGSGVSTANDRLIYSDVLGTLQPVAREGSPAAGLPAGVIYSVLGTDNSPVGDLGEIAFYATLSGTGVTSTTDESIWYSSASGTQLLAREGEQAPGLAGGVTFTGFGSVGMSRNGLAAFTGTLTGTGVNSTSDRAIWVGVPGGLNLVVREGDAAPGLSVGARFNVLPTTAHCVNTSGQIAFAGSITGTDVATANDGTLWSNGDGELRLVAREGFSAPELPPGVIFTDSFSAPLINEQGQICFTATISGPGVTSTNNETLWATDSLGALVLVMREGTTQLDVNPDPEVTDLRTVSSFGFLDVPGWNGFNDRGELAIDVTFVGSTDAIVIAALPVITQCPNCPADFDEDGGVTGADIAAFFAEFEGGLPCADTDQDGGITGADIAVFFVAYEAGGC